MLSPKTFARVIAAAGEAARPRLGDARVLKYSQKYETWYWALPAEDDAVPYGTFLNCYRKEYSPEPLISLHWLGMEAEAKWNLNAYFVDGKVDIDKLAVAVIAHAKET